MNGGKPREFRFDVLEVVKNKSFLRFFCLRYLDNGGEITILEAIFFGASGAGCEVIGRQDYGVP